MNLRALTALVLREWQASWTDRGAYILRGLYAGLLLAGVSAVWIWVLFAIPERAEEVPDELRSVFAWFCQAQSALAAVLAAMSFSRTVCREQERGSLDFLLLSPLSRTEILLGKLAGEFLSLGALIAVGLPVLFLLLPLGGKSPLELLCLQGLLLAELLALGGLCVALAAALGRSLPVMCCALGIVGVLVAGPWVGRAWDYGPQLWLWDAWESLSPLSLLEQQLGSVRPEFGLLLKTLAVAGGLAILCCGLGSLVLERRYVQGRHMGGMKAFGARLRRFAERPRVTPWFKPFFRSSNPLVERELSCGYDPFFRILWVLLACGYGGAVLMVIGDYPLDWEPNLVLGLWGMAVGALLTVLTGAVRLSTDVRRGTLAALLSAGVSPEDLVRAHLSGLLLRVVYLLLFPVLHLLKLAFVLKIRGWPGVDWIQFSGHLAAALVALGVSVCFVAGVTVWSALEFRRSEVAVGVALVLGTGAVGASLLLLGGWLTATVVFLPLAVGVLLGGYAFLIRRAAKLVLANPA